MPEGAGALTISTSVIFELFYLAPSLTSPGAASWETCEMNLGAWREITDVYGGKITKAWYRRSGRMVTVRTSFGSKTAQISGQTPDSLVRTLLRELVEKRT
jgi:hypothetical protein